MTDYDHTIDLLDELDNISKIHLLERDVIDEMMIEFASRIIFNLRIERMSVWIFNSGKSELESMGEYDSRDKSFKKKTVLEMSRYPKYFEALRKNKIILAENIHTDVNTFEFSESYAKPNGIITLMDIPLRIAGELIGVMCFEKTGVNEKFFSPREQSFAFSVALVFASNLEARHRRAAQHELNKSLKEKDLLIKEMNHRIKNNFSILISLLHLRKQKVLSEETKKVLEEYEQRIFSMMTIHDLLRETDSHLEVDIGEYMIKLVDQFSGAHAHYSTNIKANIQLDEFMVDSRTVVYLGLIVTEIFLNSFKYVYRDDQKYFLELNGYLNEDGAFCLDVEDSGSNFDFESSISSETLGLSLIKDLSEDLDLKAKFPDKNSNTFRFCLPK